MCFSSPDMPAPPPPPAEPPKAPNTEGQPSKQKQQGGGVFSKTLLTREFDAPGQSLLGSSGSGSGSVTGSA